MSTSDLERYFDQLADEELLRRLRSGSLLPEAEGIAQAEAHRRNLAVPPPRMNSVAEGHGEETLTYLGDMVIFESGLTPTEAHVLCSFLEMAGIHAETGDTNTVQANSLWHVALGGAKIRVPLAQLAEAKEILLAYGRGDFELGDDFDANDGVA